ncbi:unnamed protein product [Merluccius merluccius]
MSTRMETTFYDDPLNAFSHHHHHHHHHHDSPAYGYGHAKPAKHGMTLDLVAAGGDPAGALMMKPHLRAKAAAAAATGVGGGQDVLLTSPDVGLLKLGSPELERLIIQSGNGLVTTTPTPTHFICPKNVTDEQEGFAEGFVRALAELHHQHMPNGTPAAAAAAAVVLGGGVTSAPTTTTTTTGGVSVPPVPPLPAVSSAIVMRSESPVYEDLSTFNPSIISTVSAAAAPSYTTTPPPPAAASALSFPAAPQLPMYGQHHHQQQHQEQHQPHPQHQHQHPAPLPRLAALKEEPQTVPEMPGETPPLSPIDMESQERIKAERKRMRNRIAASKCRKRKLERISRLEDKVKNLKCQNSELSSTANMLREQVAQLKQKVMNHVNSGCQLMLTQQLQTF